MQFFEDGDDVVTNWHPSTHHQGWVDTLHGGVIATLADETAAWVITRKLQTTGMTARLNVQYLQPVSVSSGRVTVRAHLSRQMRNFAVVSVDLLDADDRLCATAEVTYFVFGPERAAQMGFAGCELE